MIFFFGTLGALALIGCGDTAGGAQDFLASLGDFTAMTGDMAGGGGTPDLKFRPDPNGFMFENYGTGNFTNLTPVELKRLFGDGACGSTMGGCVPTPAGQAWMEQQNKGMDGGHCEGFAALSLLFFLQKKAPGDFGGPSTHALALDGNTNLQREIAYWFVTQSTSPTREMTLSGKSPNEILDALTVALANGMTGET